MKTDFLKELGLEKDVIDKIMAENGKDVEGYKNQVSTLTTEKGTLTEQLSAANKQIEDFKALDVEGIKAAADDYKAKFEAAEAKAKADMEKLQFDHALSAALSDVKAREPKAVAALLDMEGLKLNNGEIVGLKDQLEKLKSEKDFLFDSDEPTPRVVASTRGGGSLSDDSAIRAVMGLPVKQ